MEPINTPACNEHAPAPLEHVPEPVETIALDPYDLATPLLDQRVRQLRRQVRFPRYYKHDQNW